MNWIHLNAVEQLEDIKKSASYTVIFKHSTRCSISVMAKRSFEQDAVDIPDGTPVYYLDLLSYRDISSKTAEIFQVHHQSPQMLLIKDGECVYESSHNEISVDDLLEQMN
jgi:bacillithiol system protein YtxJ